MLTGLLAAVPPGLIPPGAERLPGFRLATADERPTGYETGFWLDVPAVDMPVYMAHLEERFRSSGGVLDVRKVTSLAEVATVTSRVANCSGLGARALANDDTVLPMRGPKLVVENPGLDTFFIVGPPSPVGTSWHPHGDKVVVGGSAIESWDTTPDADEARAMLERVAAIEPRFKDVRVLEHRVGLRPFRPTVRLEAESVHGATVVHNYGHGGLGVTLCWGCARDAAALLSAA